MIRTYSELIRFPTFEERFDYLVLHGIVGDETFGSKRYFNQLFYRSPEWKSIRRKVIIRDNACDLGIDDRQIFDQIFIHHINPITLEDIQKKDSNVFDLENLICVSYRTHEAIHFGNSDLLIGSVPVTRQPYDTCPWRNR